MTTKTLSRRQFAAGGVGLVGAAALAKPAIAQANWPDKPVKMIVPYAPGGATDILARPWSEKLAQAFGQPFVIENRGGASGTIGAEAAAKAAPDGYTLFFTPNNTLNVFPLLKKTSYDPMKSFEPIGRAGDMVVGFAINPAVGVKSFKELIDHAKKSPGKLAFASSGVGTATQMRLEMLKLKAGIDILHVPYRGGADALNDVLANNAQLMNEFEQPAACQGEQADPAQRQSLRAQHRVSRRTDLDRARLSGSGRSDLVLDLGPGGVAEGDRRQAQCEDARNCQERRHEEATSGRRLRISRSRSGRYDEVPR